MWIRALRVQHFGHFADRTLDFGEKPGFTIIYGRNGAGKTTFLHALRSVLFGIPKNTPYASSAADAVAPVVSGVLESRDGCRFEVVRHKEKEQFIGSKTEASGRRAPLDTRTFELSVRIESRELYDSVFGFTLGDLEAGRDILTQATFDHLLSGGALGRDGAARVGAVTAMLQKEMDTLWKQSGRSQSIHKHRHELDALAKRRRQHTATRAHYDRLQQDRRAAAQRRDQLNAEATAARLEQMRLNALIEAFPHRQERVRLDESLRLISEQTEMPLTSLPSSASVQSVLDAVAAARSAREQRDGIRDELDRLEASIAQNTPDPNALVYDLQIQALVRDVSLAARRNSEFSRSVEASNRREADLLSEAKRLSERMYGLDEHGIDNLQDFRDLRDWLDATAHEHEYVYLGQTLASIREADSQYEGQCAAAKRELDRAAAELKENEAILAGIAAAGHVEDARTLHACLPVYRATVAEWERLLSDRKERAVLLHTFALSTFPPVPGFESEAELAGRAVPEEGAVRDLRSRHQTLEQARAAARASLGQEQNALAQSQHRLEAARHRLADVPDAEELSRLRERRDVILSEEMSGSGSDVVGFIPTHKELVSESVRAADSLADRRFIHAGAIAELEELERQTALRRATADRFEAELAEADAAIAGWNNCWEEFWGRYGLPHGVCAATDHTTLSDWRTRCAALQEKSREIILLDAKIASLAERIAPLDTTLEAIAASDSPRSRDQRMTAVDAMVREADRQEGRRDEIRLKVAAAERELQAWRTELDQLERARELMEQEKETLLARAGVRTSLTVEESHFVLERVNAVRDAWLELDEARSNEAGEREFLSRFFAAAEETHRRLEPNGDDFKAALASEYAAAWDARLREARTVESKRTAFLQEHQVKSTADTAALRRCAETGASVDEWLGATGVKNEAELRRLAELARDSFAVRADIASRDVLISSLVKSEADRELLARAGTAGYADWQTRLSNLDARLLAFNDDIEKAHADAARNDAAMEAMGGGEAALAHAQIEETRAKMEEDADRYAVRYLAHRVLQNVTAQYAQVNQPELLRESSRLMEGITGGEYVRVHQASGGKNLSLEPKDGSASRNSERLSTGEREQLFLALRLAFVTRHCNTVAPLPIALDDVLVNFDEDRAAATLQVLSDVSKITQVLFFTCHRDLRDLAKEMVPGATVCELG